MKKNPSLLFAVVSTMLLAVGATRAAEKFDPLRRSNDLASPAMLHEGPGLPCVTDPGPEPDPDPIQLPPLPPPYDWPDGTLTEE